jgi:4-amino-4-deoxy-L-arabinose transferase-like glycosyltransferase
VAPTDTAASDTSPLSPTARILWATLILATLYLCYFHNLGAIGLIGPDEPRYAWIARDMAETGDWVTPRLYGKPWFEKPPLYYWGAAACFKVFGVSETTARLPSAICALLATLALAWLAWRIYGAETARWLLLLLPTSVGMIGFSHAAATDMPFAAMLTIAMVFAAILLKLLPPSDPHALSPSLFSSTSLTSSTSFTSILFGFFLGLATLAKGPAAIILSGGAVFFWAIFTKRWRDAFRCLHPLAIASFCLTALPWYILCARRNPDFFRVFIIEHNFKRFLTPEFQHIQPLWFYIPILLIAAFPWTLALLFEAVSRVALIWKTRQLQVSHPTTLFCAWILFCLLFFSISRSKLPGYILPAIPPTLLLIARSIQTKLRDASIILRWALLATGLSLVVFGISLQQQTPKIPAFLCVSPECGITRIWIFAAAGGIGIAALAALRKFPASLYATVLAVLLLVVEIDRFLPNLDPGVSGRDAARVVANVWPEFKPQNAAAWQLSRSFLYQLSFYNRVELPEWKPDEPQPAWLFVAKGKKSEATNLGFRCVNFAIDPAVIPCRAAGSVSGFGGSGSGSLGSGSSDSGGSRRNNR